MNSTSFGRARFPGARFLILCAAILLSLQVVFCRGQLKIYYVRHGESGHNVEKHWKNTPKELWPPYVGNSDTFSTEGEAQVVALTEKLKGMQFDFIATSPLWRTRHTILPWLKAMSLKAEVWPELSETARVPDTAIFSKNLPAPTRALFAGDPIVLPEEEAPFLILIDSAKTTPVKARDSSQAIADAIALSKQVMRNIHERFEGTDKSILLVGHGNAGLTLLRLLTGVIPGESLKNTAIWMAEEQSDGTFDLKMLNNKPFEAKKKLLREAQGQ